MKPSFWKLSQGGKMFGFDEIVEIIADKLVYIHRDTGAKGTRGTSQAEDFVNAEIGDYFYLTHGNNYIFLFGQFTGPANFFSKYPRWIDRPFRLISSSDNKDPYSGEERWWTPNHNSTFMRVPDDQLKEFERLILEPYFNLKLTALIKKMMK